MSENYDVYKSRQRRSRTRQNQKQNTYIKKLTKQMLVSFTCLALIYFMEISNTSWGNAINNSIKGALNYEINTDGIQAGITSVLDKLVKKTNNGESTDVKTQTSSYKDI